MRETSGADPSPVGDATGPVGADPSPAGDKVSAVVGPLLADHPEAVFYAIGSDGIIVPMPASVNLRGHVLAEGRSALDLVHPEDRTKVIDAWVKVRTTGIATSQVRLRAEPDSVATLHFIDTQDRYGVYIGVFTAGENIDDVGVTRIAQTSPSRAPRFARVRKDEAAVVVEVDQAFTQILGWQPPEILGQRTLEIIHPDDQGLAIDNWMDMLASQGPGRRVKLRHKHRDGSWVWMEITNHNLLQDPDHSCVVAEMVDISEEMAAQEALRAREQLLNRLAEALPVGLLQVDSDARVVYTNDRLHRMLGTERAETVEEQLQNVTDDDREVLEDAFAAVLSDGTDSDIEVRIGVGERDKELLFCSLSLRALTDESGGVTGAIVCFADVTESARSREELRVRADYDEVTRCHNRSSTMAALEGFVADGQCRPAVIFVDLDDFKHVNDALGHAAGDEFLRVVAERLHRGVRSEDLVGRIGGDEFLVICPRISDSVEAMSTAVRLAQNLGHHIRLKSASLPSHASIGVAWSPDPEVTAATLVAQADAAMYRAKNTESSYPVLFDDSLPLSTGGWHWPAPPDARPSAGPVPNHETRSSRPRTAGPPQGLHDPRPTARQ
ncbi:MAG TPA: sensor domain-containing diguanylate cyclase [Acidimicrobiales bacterium]|nr:sensor domain-containing diguanylate cyclase [Acidimicrobiales bacterium]